MPHRRVLIVIYNYSAITIRAYNTNLNIHTRLRRLRSYSTPSTHVLSVVSTLLRGERVKRMYFKISSALMLSGKSCHAINKLSSQDGCWNLELQGMQEDYDWWLLAASVSIL